MLGELRMRTFREATIDDLPVLVQLTNRAQPWERPIALELLRHREATRDPSLPFLRLLAEEGGRLIGVGTAGPPPWLPRHLVQMAVTVDPEAQRRGIGSALFRQLLPLPTHMVRS